MVTFTAETNLPAGRRVSNPTFIAGPSRDEWVVKMISFGNEFKKGDGDEKMECHF